MDILELMEQRHSVRQYKSQKIEQEKRAVLDSLAAECCKESGLDIQIVYDEPKCFGALLAKVTRFRGCENYIVIAGKQDDLSAEEKAGYYGEMIVLKAQELGLNTCWVGLTHGKVLAELPSGEKRIIIIALGYGENAGVSRKSKTLSEVSDVTEDLPEWYEKGIRAALLAPTAVNQQKFRFTLNGEYASVEAGRGSYTQVDLGIVKYHFEAASGHKLE